MTELADQATRGLSFKREALQYPSPLRRRKELYPPKLAWNPRMSPKTAVFEKSGSNEIMLVWGRVRSYWPSGPSACTC